MNTETEGNAAQEKEKQQTKIDNYDNDDVTNRSSSSSSRNSIIATIAEQNFGFPYSIFIPFFVFSEGSKCHLN